MKKGSHKKFEEIVNWFKTKIYSKSYENIAFLMIEFVTFKMIHLAFVNKGQIPCVIILILTLIDKCKMCHFECHGLNYNYDY
jgi:hypothetical protein